MCAPACSNKTRIKNGFGCTSYHINKYFTLNWFGLIGLNYSYYFLKESYYFRYFSNTSNITRTH